MWRVERERERDAEGNEESEKVSLLSIRKEDTWRLLFDLFKF